MKDEAKLASGTNLEAAHKLHPADVSVIFVETGNAEVGAKMQRLRLNQQSDFIDKWPGGFFEEDFNELF